MTCEVCGIGQRKARKIRYSLTIDGRRILVDNVPAEVCERCGEVTLSPDVVERLQQIVWQRHSPARVIETLVYEFA